MLYKPTTAKAELTFYDSLPFHENIPRVHGCHIHEETKRWCLAVEYCRHGTCESMRSGKFPLNGGFAHHLISGVVSALGALHGTRWRTGT